MNINTYMFQKQTELLGPFKRSVLWVQGCLRNCEGCIAANSHSLNEEFLINAGILAHMFIDEKETEGITISGGEPFLQAEGVFEMIKIIKKERPDYGVIVYTGNQYEDLLSSRSAAVKSLLEETDILIDGEYIHNLNDGMHAVGSSNQRIIRLTERYSEHIINNYYRKKSDRKVTFSINHNQITMTGVPSRESLDAWNTIKKIGKGE